MKNFMFQNFIRFLNISSNRILIAIKPQGLLIFLFVLEAMQQINLVMRERSTKSKKLNIVYTFKL